MSSITGSTPLSVSQDAQASLTTDPTQQSSGQLSAIEERSRKRDFFRFGKKDEDKKNSKSTGVPQTMPGGGPRPVSPLAGIDPSRNPGSPSYNHPYGIASSPRGMRSASPRTHSPASSMIFERSVQEDVGAIAQASPQIPSHIITENHIPPALDATSEAITDKKLDPDSVEIVTHTAHQPAAVTITEGHHDQTASPILSDNNLSSTVRPELPTETSSNSASNYANLDSVDVRRLSFISFADVVHGEHDLSSGEARRDSAIITSHPSFHNIARSPSPFRSPVPSQNATGISPPASHETSPHRPAAAQLGDLNIQTMSQALRRTGSGDMSGFRSASISATGNDEGIERSLR